MVIIRKASSINYQLFWGLGDLGTYGQEISTRNQVEFFLEDDQDRLAVLLDEINCWGLNWNGKSYITIDDAILSEGLVAFWPPLLLVYIKKKVMMMSGFWNLSTSESAGIRQFFYDKVFLSV